jgi:hypothetical protein
MERVNLELRFDTFNLFNRVNLMAVDPKLQDTTFGQSSSTYAARNILLGATELANVPIGGFNNYQSLLSLLPGATPSRYQNSVMDTPSRSLTANINGSSRNGNVASVDGAAIQQVYLPHQTPLLLSRASQEASSSRF